MKGIRVSIGVPTIGDNPFVWSALASAIANLPHDGELVISDNASEIGGQLEAFARNEHFNIVTVRQSNRIPMADNWNQCLAHARGEYFLLLSDDDVLCPDMVAGLTHALDVNPEAGLAYCRFRWIDESGKAFWTSPGALRLESSRDVIAGVFARTRVVLPSATIFRRRDLVAIGGYDARFGNWADLAAWIQIGARYRHVLFDSKVLMQYRERKTSLTKMANDAAWISGIDNTLALLEELYRADAKLRTAGLRYKAYMLADIRLKRLLVENASVMDLVTQTWRAGNALPLRQRSWLALKSAYLRIFARLNSSR